MIITGLLCVACTSGGLRDYIHESAARWDAHDSRVAQLDAAIEEGDVSAETAIARLQAELDFYKAELARLVEAIEADGESVLGALDPKSAGGGATVGAILAWLASYLRAKVARGPRREQSPNDPPVFPS